MYFECYVCERKLPLAVKEEHHETPQATGGVDEGTFDLCAGCHKNVHIVSRMMLSKKNRDKAAAVMAELYPNERQRKKHEHFVRVEVTETIKKRSGMLTEDRKSKIKFKLTLEFDPKVRKGLRLLSKERKVSMERYVQDLVTAKLKSEFPKLME